MATLIVIITFGTPSIWAISILLESYEIIPKGWWRLSQFGWYRRLRRGSWYFDDRRSVYHDNIYPRWRRGKAD